MPDPRYDSFIVGDTDPVEPIGWDGADECLECDENFADDERRGLLEIDTNES